MSPVPTSRLALVLSLVVLGSSLAVFGSVTGIVPDGNHEFAIESGALVATTESGQQHALVEDVRTVARIKIERTDGYYIVRTVDREPTTINKQTRIRTRRIVMSAETVGGSIPTMDNGTYAIRRVPAHLSSDQAAAIGATPNASLRTALVSNASAFAIRQQADTVVFERRESQWSDDRVLVIVTPDESGVQYGAVVDLRTETIESLVRLDGGGR